MAGSRIPRIESIIIAIFFMGVALWAVNKCTSKRTEVVQRIKNYARGEEEEERPVRRDTVAVPKPAPTTAPAPVEHTSPEPQQAAPAAPSKPGKVPKLSNQPAQSAPAPTKPETAAPPATSTSGTTLYVTIDGLRMRKEPGLKGELVAKLKLYEPVTFLNKKTEWTQEISLGTEKVVDHWVKVRTKSGKEGWVFGAGVHYYKMKRKGVLE